MTANTYTDRTDARRERFEALAEKARKLSSAHQGRAHEMGQAIPFGQPILVGHHSEQRDRNYRAKIGRHMDKSLELQRKAEYYEQKAAAVGRGGISSDDPEAVAKLKEKLAALEAGQETMKAANKVIRNKRLDDAGKVAELVKLGLSDAQAAEALRPDYGGRVGFPAYALQNNNANMARIRERIADLEREAERAPIAQTFEGFEVKEEDNRVQFIFPGKPSAEVRDVLKRHAFKWSPSRGAWVRMQNGAGRYAAQCVIEALKKLPQ